MDEKTIEARQEALKVLFSAIELAQKRGAFSLEEANQIWEKMSLFTNKKVTAPIDTIRE